MTLCLCAVVVPVAETPAQDAKVYAYFASAARTLDPRPRAVLRSIPNRSRRLLAIAHFLRHRQQLAERWSWSDGEIGAYRKTEAYRQMLTEIRTVRRTFDSLNPGYRLVAGPGGRSLNEQVRNWNRERSVAAAAREFLDSCSLRLSDGSYPVVPDSGGLARFMEAVARLETGRLPTVAVPGLSLHGQFRAIDFAILRGRRIVAGTSSASVERVWVAGGWADRLKHAVMLASGSFVGPLETPLEPWHYAYRPTTDDQPELVARAEASQ